MTLVFLVIFAAVLIFFSATGAMHDRPAMVLVGVVAVLLSFFSLSGFFVVNPNEARVILFAARQKIVDGAVGMVELALERLARNRVLDRDEGRKAVMVANLLVVLCSEHASQPVINAGTA